MIIHETMAYECLDEEHAIAKLALNDTWKWIPDNVAASRNTNAWKAEFVNNLRRWSCHASTTEVKERLLGPVWRKRLRVEIWRRRKTRQNTSWTNLPFGPAWGECLPQECRVWATEFEQTLGILQASSSSNARNEIQEEEPGTPTWHPVGG